MKVEILESGTQAKELNPVELEKEQYVGDSYGQWLEKNRVRRKNAYRAKKYLKAEQSRKVYEIDAESLVINSWDNMYRKSDGKKYRCENDTSQSGVIFKTATATEGKLWINGAQYFNRSEVFKFLPGSIHEAELIPGTDKIRIL